MGKLQIEDKRQQEESGENPKKEESPLALPPPQQVQGESSQDLPKDWKFVINHPQDQIIGNPSSGHDGRTQFLPWTSNQATKGRNFINQAKYIKDLLKRFNMEEAKVMKTPMSSSIKLDMMKKGKRPVEPSQPEQTEARRKARYDTALFSSNKDYQRYKQKFAQRKVVLGRSVNFSHLQHFGFEGLFGRMGWLPVVTISKLVFPTLVRAFYSRATYMLGGPVLSTVRGVEIHLSPESICRILDIPSLDFMFMRPRRGPLCQDLSLERLFRGCADLLILKDGQTIGSQLDSD
ncbi:hypothetical protein CK203_073217 [Vitis vinifera]|uniref:Uncharacterized protein n=1 Tax=Vitis vinifera TaxID=29760 RepID=A0A438ENE3_VITVI|nr:hypothetical protein CK203_073217 [Vitis vinifera]